MPDTTNTNRTPDRPTFLDAVAEFAPVFSRPDTAADLATRLSCREVDALAEMLRACGQVDAAEMWIEEHVTDDDEGDAHPTERGSEQ